MKIHSKDFRVRPGEKAKLSEWPTVVKPFCKSKDGYKRLLGEHIEALSSLQRLHYASIRFAEHFIPQLLKIKPFRRLAPERDDGAEELNAAGRL